jgi:hypothetical protein
MASTTGANQPPVLVFLPEEPLSTAKRQAGKIRRGPALFCRAKFAKVV